MRSHVCSFLFFVVVLIWIHVHGRCATMSMFMTDLCSRPKNNGLFKHVDNYRIHINSFIFTSFFLLRPQLNLFDSSYLTQLKSCCVIIFFFPFFFFCSSLRFVFVLNFLKFVLLFPLSIRKGTLGFFWINLVKTDFKLLILSSTESRTKHLHCS